MNSVIVLFATVCLALVCGQKYTEKYDNVDLDAIIRNDRLLQNYVNCLLDKGKCTTDGAELKRILPDALQTACSKCSEKQKNGSKKIVNHLIDNKPTVWSELEKKYDPQGVYLKKYKAEAKTQGVHL